QPSHDRSRRTSLAELGIDLRLIVDSPLLPPCCFRDLPVQFTSGFSRYYRLAPLYTLTPRPAPRHPVAHEDPHKPGALAGHTLGIGEEIPIPFGHAFVNLGGDIPR